MPTLPVPHGWMELMDHLERDHGKNRDALETVDTDELRRVHAAEHATGIARLTTESASDDIAEPLALIQETFPGASAVEDVDTTLPPGPLRRPKRTATIGSPLVDELVVAVDEMVDHFKRHEPKRLERDGWKRIVRALAAVKRASRVDTTTKAGGAPVQANHPETAKIAAGIVNVGTQQHMVLELLADADDGATAYELAQHPRFQRLRPSIPPNQVATRIDELHRMGCVEQLIDDAMMPRTRDAAAGPADIHTLTEHGESELLRLGPHPTD